MKIENQVCTLEQAKRFRELGIRGSEFKWKEFQNKKTKEVVIGWTFGGVGEWQSLKSYTVIGDYPAFTVAELGIMLPTNCQSFYNHHHNHWVCEMVEPWDEEDEPNATPYVFEGWKLTAIINDEEMQTESQARAAMLICLLENNLTTVEEVKKRLNDKS